MHSTRRQFLGHLSAAGAASALALPARAADYPAKPVKLVVPWPVGGVVDIATRIVADDIAARWGQPIVIDNRSGANGNIGTDFVRSARADGYTLLVGSMALVINPLIDKTARYTVDDFVPIAAIGSAPNLLLVPADAPARSLQDFVAQARQHPGRYNTPNPGAGTSNHLGLELLMQATGIELTQINYKGQPPFMPDLLNGQLHFALVTAALALPQVASGRLRALAVCAPQRLQALPDVPTLSEAGVPNATVLPWSGLFAPAGTPPEITERLAAEIGQSLRSPQTVRRNAQISAQVAAEPHAFAQFIAAEKARWPRLVAERAISVAAL